jgi:acyl dehydratase|tara:strand:+ start:2956 stop:3198 length:243 start_codon:yes stop_codon:yes gene_type:complete
MLTMGITGRLLTHTVGNGRLTRYGVRFTAQVRPGDDLSASATVTAIDRVDGAPIAEFSLETKNQDEVVVLSGSAAARLDP